MRKQNWNAILTDKIEEYKSIPFVWGVSDCLQFSGQVAAAMLDYDPYEKVGSYHYDSEEAAGQMLQDHFDGDMGNVFSTAFEEIRPRMAGRGDIAIVEFKDTEICGVIDSSGRLVACKSVDGLLFVPMIYIQRAWRVE